MFILNNASKVCNLSMIVLVAVKLLYAEGSAWIILPMMVCTFFGIAIFSFDWSVEVVKILPNVVATLLGLFGVFVVYILTLLNSQIKELKKKSAVGKARKVISNSDTTYDPIINEELVLNKKMQNIIKLTVITFSCFILSLIFSLITLNLRTNEQHFMPFEYKLVCIIALIFLFVGILATIYVILRIGRDAKRDFSTVS